MSMSIPRSTFALNDPAAASRSGNSQPERDEDDFAAFLVAPSESRTPLGARDTPAERETSEPEVSSVEETRPEKNLDAASREPSTEKAAVAAEPANATRSPLPARPEPATVRVAPSDSKGRFCEMPEKLPGQTFSTAKPAQGAGAVWADIPGLPLVPVDEVSPAAPEPVFPSSPGTNAPDLKPTAGPAIPAEPEALPLPFAGRPGNLIEIDLKGKAELRVDSAGYVSAWVDPAADFTVTPRMRASLAEIAEVLRAGSEGGEAVTGVSDIGEPATSNESSSDGSAPFADTSGGPLPQPAGLPQVQSSAAAGAARSLAQIEAEMLQLSSALKFRNDGSSLKLRLESGDLGAVEITLVRHESGAMSAHLVTESESSRSALTENLIQLRSSLESAGLQLQELDISCRSFSADTQGSRHEGEGRHGFVPEIHAPATTDSGGIHEANGDGDSRLLNLRA